MFRFESEKFKQVKHVIAAGSAARTKRSEGVKQLVFLGEAMYATHMWSRGDAPENFGFSSILDT